MSTKIPLYFRTRFSADGTPTTRLFAWVSLKGFEKETEPMKAIIDTGSPVTLIPFRAWGQALVEMGEHEMLPTISERPECNLGVTHGEVTISLLDAEGKKLVEGLKLPADLCDTREMPFLLGMHEFLKRGRLVMDYPAGEAWLELEELPPSSNPTGEQDF